ncbi:RNA polymerase sigma factor SigM [Dietzia sp.]|uniref:RNA polymerase sigma factor SigM n=1 Tax=Dietzia sp. TaxID=1871616 RepID=UPI002FDB64D7
MSNPTALEVPPPPAASARPGAAGAVAHSAGAGETECPDIELLRRHIGGDESAFAALVRRHYDVLWRTALRTSVSPEDASDSLQEALLSAARQARTFRGESAVRGWMYTIVVNACRDRMRRALRLRCVELTPVLAEQVSYRTLYYQSPVWSLVVAEALREIPEGMRNAVILVDMYGLTVADAAFLLNVPVGTVKSRCTRGRRHLAPRLEGITLSQ